MHWQTHNYTGGRYQPITDLLAAGTHEIQIWGNASEGWWPYLVSVGTTTGCQVGPGFSRECGDTMRMLKEAASRHFGVPANTIRKG